MSFSLPTGFNVQGRLTDSNGINRDASDFNIKFSLYDAAAGGNLLWSKVLYPVAVKNGNFQAMLEDPGVGGKFQYLKDVFSGDSVYLEYQVLSGGGISAAEAPITPRQKLLSVPFALVAQEADSEVVPRGVMVAWGGSLNADIFNNGWCLCDGRTCQAPDGNMVTTPDLSDRFVMAGTPTEIGVSGGSDNPAIDLPGVWTSDLSGWSFHSQPGLTKYSAGYPYIFGRHRKHLLDVPPFQPGVKALYPKYFKLAFIMKL
ncbi:MAG: hypothetical protein KKH28_07670 [Elusimicrobia bacterium]|nr:hypothetical protein [Elusimicrobiota bacterium]